MKYIVWDLISSYDGYAITNCDNWEEVLVAVKKVTTQEEYVKFANESFVCKVY